MKKHIVTIAIAALSLSAYAGGNEHHGHPNHGPRHPSVSQGQGQSQSSVNANLNINSARGGRANQGQSQTNAGNSVQGGAVSVNADTMVPRQTATAYAPSFATNGSCLGAASGGIQGPGFGISGGSTTLDAACSARYDAEALRAAGEPKAAIARLCLTPEIAEAMMNADTPCPKPVKAQQAVAGYTGSDPYVIARLAKEQK